MVPHNFVSAILNEGTEPSSQYVPQGENNVSNNSLNGPNINGNGSNPVLPINGNGSNPVLPINGNINPLNNSSNLPVTNTPENGYITTDKYFYSHFGQHTVNYNVQPPLPVSQNSNLPFSVPAFNAHNMNPRTHDGIQHPNMPVAMNFSLHGMHHVHNVGTGTDLRFPIATHNMEYNAGFTGMNQNIDENTARQKLLAEIYNPTTSATKQEVNPNDHQNANNFGVVKPKTKKIRKPSADDGSKPYVCDHCGYRSKCVTNLNIHKRTHTGEKPFGCETCGKRFISRGELIRHERVHTGEKPYTCDICQKRFARSSTLSNHKIVHMREKIYKCHLCPFATHRKSYLEDHLKGIGEHSDDRPHVCDLCQYRTNRKTLVDIHRKKCINRGSRRPRGRKKKIKTEGQSKKSIRPGPRAVVQKQEDYSSRGNDSVSEKMESLMSHRTYKCGLCTFTASSNKDLDKHMEIHSAEKHGGKLVIQFKVPNEAGDRAQEQVC